MLNDIYKEDKNMAFNKEITGFQNENEFVTYLNGKQVGKLYPNFLDLVYHLYDDIDLKDTITCWGNKSKRKADIYIKINNRVRGISIKKGVKNSVHVEHIDSFIHFLKELDISNEIIYYFLEYHYGDGTLDGTGKKRLSSTDYRNFHQHKIDIINQTLNQEKYINAFVNRFILQGNLSKYEVNAIIYGVVEDFIWITKKEIYSIIQKHLSDSSPSLHISCLNLQPMSRNLNYNPKYEFCRNQVQVKWYNLADQIIEIMMVR